MALQPVKADKVVTVYRVDGSIQRIPVQSTDPNALRVHDGALIVQGVDAAHVFAPGQWARAVLQ